jgi:hypothetical protein
MALAMLDRLGKAFGRQAKSASLHWHPPALLDQGAIGEARFALDSSGKGLALWENAGQLWSMEQCLGSPKALVRLPVAAGQSPRLVLDPQGRGAALWTSSDEQGEVLLGMPLGWSQSRAHELFETRGRIHHLQAAVDRRGGVLAVWCHERDGRFENLAQSYDTRAGTWDRRPTPLGPLAWKPSGPGLAMNLRGHAMVVLPVDDAGFTGLACCQFWPTERIWSDRPVPICPGKVVSHRLAMDAGGNAQALLIVDESEDRQSLYASRYDSHQTEWGEPLLLAAGLRLRNLRLAMSKEGVAFAAWSQSESAGTPRLIGRWFRHGAWDKSVTSLDSGHGTVTSLALDLVGEGKGTLLTCQHSTDGHRVFLSDLNGEGSPAVPLGGAYSHPAIRPRLVQGPEGAAALWVQSMGATGTLYIAHGY